MKTIFKTFISLFLLTLLAVSCGPPPPPGLEEFYYAENGSTTMILLDSPEASANAKKIAGKSASSGMAVIDIKLSSLVVGTYLLGSGSGNEFTYKKPSVTNIWTGYRGSITITMNSGGLLAGTYDISSGTGIPSVNSIKGSFSNVEINP
jgi:hypothetical protein